VCAARMGDHRRAMEIDDTLVKIDTTVPKPGGVLGHHGVVPYLRARIATQLGDTDRAIGLLRQAVTGGFYNYLLLHREPDFQPLWNDSAFQEILRPKG